MLRALSVFQKNIAETSTLNAAYDHLEQTISNAAPISFDDILRSKLVYSVSALDKLVHDLVRIGMVEIFKNLRPSTPKYLSEPIPLSLHSQILNQSTTPAEILFEQHIIAKLKIMSFQTPDKVADGLSYIWSENQKWRQISNTLGVDEKLVKTRLTLISTRRNTIVHEADMDPINHQKFPITRQECDDVTSFILELGNSIANLVK